jgi:hypothetical protein
MTHESLYPNTDIAKNHGRIAVAKDMALSFESADLPRPKDEPIRRWTYPAQRFD